MLIGSLDSAVYRQKNIPGKFRVPTPPSLKAAGGRFRPFSIKTRKFSSFFLANFTFQLLFRIVVLRTPTTYHFCSILHSTNDIIVVPSETMSTKTPSPLQLDTPCLLQLDTPSPLQLETPSPLQLDTPSPLQLDTPS
jgi:hypothetical protein